MQPTWQPAQQRGAEPPPQAPRSPFQCGDALVPASGTPCGEASAGLPCAVSMPGLVLSLPPVLRVPVVFWLHVGPERNLKAVIENPEGELAVALRQGE